MSPKALALVVVALALPVTAHARKKTPTPEEFATALPPPTATPAPQAEIALSLPWGTGPGQMTYRKDGRGPDAVCADDFGDLWVLDAAAYRVQHFGADGRCAGVFRINTDCVDLAVAPSGQFYVINWQDARIHKFDRKGGFRMRLEYPKEIQFVENVFSFRRFFLAKDDLRMLTLQGVEYTLGNAKGSFARETIRKSRKEGLASRNGAHRYRIEAQAGAYSLVEDGRRTIPLESPAPLRSATLVDTDAQGRVHLTVNYLSGPGRNEDDLWCLDPATGKKLSVRPVRAGSLYEPFRRFEVDPNGTVYQIFGTAGRWQVLAYKPPVSSPVGPEAKPAGAQ